MPDMMIPENPTPVTSVPAKERAEKPISVNTAVQDESPERPSAFEALTGAPNPAFPLGSPGSTAGGAPAEVSPVSGPEVKAPGAAATPQGVPVALISRPARKPVDASVAKGKPQGVSPKETTEGQTGGVTFIKNRRNEIISLPNGKTYMFKKSKETVFDPEVIKGLRAVAKKYDIFEETADN
jgi:hypothetical protein